LRALGIARARGPECPVEPADVGEAGEHGEIRDLAGWLELDLAWPPEHRGAAAAST
jgi:hypothetical protein